MSVPLSNLSATWNAIGTTFTAIRMAVTDTASAAGSKLLDLIVGSTHMFQVRKDGHSALGSGAQIDSVGPGVNNWYWSDLQEIWNVQGQAAAIPDSGGAIGAAGTLIHNPLVNETGAYAIGVQGFLFVPDTVNVNAGYRIGVEAVIEDNSTGTASALSGVDCNVYKNGGTVGNITGSGALVQADDVVLTYSYGVNSVVRLDNSSSANFIYNYNATIQLSGGSTLTTAVAYYSGDLTGAATNPYYFWGDGPGVFRIKEEGSVKGAVPAGYNPAFSPKYTPGAVDFERWILQWNTGNIIEIGAEAGGTGTLRKVRHLGAGHLFPIANLPTSDPGVAGQIYTVGAPSAGVPKAMMISGG